MGVELPDIKCLRCGKVIGKGYIFAEEVVNGRIYCDDCYWAEDDEMHRYDVAEAEERM